MKPLPPLAVPGYISEAAQAARLGTTVHTLRMRRYRGEGPPFVTIGRRVAYREGADVEFLAAQEAQRTRVRAEAMRPRRRRLG